MTQRQRLYSILDAQGNIRSPVDPVSKEIADSYEFTAFGQEMHEQETPNPWRYASKRIDPDLNLIHFGKRDYDPDLGRWLTTDPLGFVDSANLYQYVFNNPFRYADPDGQFVWAIPFVFTLFEVSLPTFAVALPTLTTIGVAAGTSLVG